MQGRENLEAHFRNFINAGVAEIKLLTDEVEQHGDTVIEVSAATLHDADGNELDRAKYIVIWKKEGGTWKRLLLDRHAPADRPSVADLPLNPEQHGTGPPGDGAPGAPPGGTSS